MTDTRASQETAAPVFVEGFCRPQARKFVLISAILASALGFIDSFIVSMALPAMRASLDGSLIEGQWFHNAYMLTLSALILVGGAVGDRFGLARTFGWGIAGFVLASLLCAVAPTPEFMIVARALQGIGAAVMVPGSLAVISRAYPREERGWAIGIWAATSSATTALGPIIGGVVLTFGGPEVWRWIFAINLPLGGLAVWMIWAKVGVDPPRKAVTLDLPGAALATLGLLSIAWGLTQAGHAGGAATLWLCVGAVLLALFLWTEARSPNPMMPLALFSSATFSAANLLSFLLYAALGIMFFFMPMTFIAGWGESEFAVSAVFAPMAVFITLLSSRAGRLADRVGPAPLLTAGSVITGVGYLLMGMFAPLQDLWSVILPAMCVVGFGMALVVAPLSTAVMGAAPEDQSGIASGINNAVSRTASLVGVAAVGGLVTSVYLGAGGMESFGIESETDGHGSAMTAAFSAVAYLSAALCAASAAVSAMLLRRAGPAGNAS